MGIDYFLINETKKEYIWTGRLNLVYDWDNQHKHITNNMLEEALIQHFDDSISYLDGYILKDFVRYRLMYNLIKRYIKGCYCYVMPDTEELPKGYFNNMPLEDAIVWDSEFRENICCQLM